MTRALTPFLALACTICAFACGSAQPKLVGSAGALDATRELELVMGEELRAAREEGAGEPLLGLVGAGIPGDSLGGLVELPENQCALILGRSSANVQDVDVFAFAEEGTVIAADESPAKHATLLACPPHPPRAFVSGRLAAGFGLFAVTVHVVDEDRASALAQRFSVAANRSTEARDIDAAWPGLDERLAEHRRRLGGQWESVRKIAVPLDPRVYTNVSARVDAGRCIDVLLTPSEEVAHLELEVLESNGRWIGSGQARGADRNLTLCSADARELVLRSRPHAGRGLGAIVISRSASGTSREIQPDAARFDLRPQTPLSELARELAESLAAAGYAPAVTQRRGRLELERRTSLDLSLAKGCSRIDVLTAAPVSTIRAWLWSGGGQLLAEDGRAIGATLFTCGGGGSARLDLETLASGGEFALDVRHSPSLPSGAAAHPLAASRLLALLDARGLLSSIEHVPALQRAEVSDGELSRSELRLRAGRCLHVSGALGPGASGLEVRLHEPGSARDEAGRDDATLGYGPRAATARVCALEPARDRVVIAELRANVGRGVALWTSQELEPDARIDARAGRSSSARER